jgi:hypothetical protein
MAAAWGTIARLCAADARSADGRHDGLDRAEPVRVSAPGSLAVLGNAGACRGSNAAFRSGDGLPARCSG